MRERRISRKDFFEQLGRLALTTRGETPDEGGLEEYYAALGDLALDVLEAAIGRCVQTCTWFPAPAEIRSRAVEVLERAGVVPAAPSDAWAAVVAVASRGGGMQAADRQLEPLTCDALDDIGGAHVLAAIAVGELRLHRRTYLERYTELRERELDGGLIYQSLLAVTPAQPSLLRAVPKPGRQQA